MNKRKPRLVDCNPRWVHWREDGPIDGVAFECPEGHLNCFHSIPFTPDFSDGKHPSSKKNGAQWKRSGLATFDGLTLTPSIRTPRGPHGCELHVTLTKGVFRFHGDSR